MDNETLLLKIESYCNFKERDWNPLTARNNRYFFRILEEFLNGSPLNNESVLNFFNNLKARGLSEWTRRGGEKTIMAFCKWLHENGHTDKNFTSGLKRTKIHSKIELLPTQQQALDLIEQATEPSPKERRLGRFSKQEHRACLKFILTAFGGRNYEVSKILRKDVNLSTLEVVLREGKGGERMQSIPPIEWLLEDLKRRVKGHRTPEELQVLKDRTHYKESDLDRLFVVNPYTLRQTMRRFSKLYGSRITVHNLRKIFANDMHNNGADVDRIRDSMGHKALETTIGYLQHNTRTQRKAINTFSSEARKYRTNEEKLKELVDHATSLGLNVKFDSKKLKLEVGT